MGSLFHVMQTLTHTLKELKNTLTSLRLWALSNLAVLKLTHKESQIGLFKGLPSRKALPSDSAGGTYRFVWSPVFSRSRVF